MAVPISMGFPGEGHADMTTTTLIHRLERNAESRARDVALRDRLSGVWREQTWAEYNAATRQLGKSLMASAVAHGDVVSILAPNRPEWLIGALGAMRKSMGLPGPAEKVMAAREASA